MLTLQFPALQAGWTEQEHEGPHSYNEPMDLQDSSVLPTEEPTRTELSQAA